MKELEGTDRNSKVLDKQALWIMTSGLVDGAQPSSQTPGRIQKVDPPQGSHN